MTTRADYDTDQWKIIVRAPGYVGLYVITADIGITSVFKEAGGLAEAVDSGERPDVVRALIADIAADLKALGQSSDKEAKEAERKAAEDQLGTDMRAGSRRLIGEAMETVRGRGGEAEAAGFGAWLMVLAQATAEAGKEGGVLGIGAVRVSDKEKEALAELAEVVGATPA